MFTLWLLVLRRGQRLGWARRSSLWLLWQGVLGLLGAGRWLSRLLLFFDHSKSIRLRLIKVIVSRNPKLILILALKMSPTLYHLAHIQRLVYLSLLHLIRGLPNFKHLLLLLCQQLIPGHRYVWRRGLFPRRDLIRRLLLLLMMTRTGVHNLLHCVLRDAMSLLAGLRVERAVWGKVEGILVDLLLGLGHQRATSTGILAKVVKIVC